MTPPDGGGNDSGTGSGGGGLIDGGDDGIGIDGGGGVGPEPEPEPKSECGNGELEPGEFCDDGNKRDGDGCSADCSTQDPTYSCLEPGQPCVNLVVCGNERIEGDEACDDGNKSSGDGCSADCSTVEEGYACPRPGVACVPLPICGNGVRERGEQCDDGGTASGDGCTGTEEGVTPCQLEDGFFCPQPGQTCIELRCGDGNRTPDEECDDGQDPPQNGDGCSSTCRLEPGFRCSGTVCGPVCGDGFVVAGEQCDDGNRVSGDGCSGACTREPFFNCSGSPSTCTSTIQCGNGTLEPGEICDPPGVDGCLPGCRSFAPDSGVGSVCGNGVIEPGESCDRPMPGAGCTTGCVVESGWACPMPDTCYRLPFCGDGIMQANEECDVGPVSAPGCIQCEVQTGWICYGNEPSVCEQPLCGDGVLTPDEECDDSNGQAGDGCTNCAVDTGWVCPTVGERCIPICGDGILNGDEECDDSNRLNDDGCNAACRIEPGYACPDVGSPCVAAVCGNGNPADPIGAAEPGEGCDDGNRIAGDGCGPTCQLEPEITPGPNPVVRTTCGDGLRTGSEECDDGNTTSGDGCSSTCEEENGFDCTELLELPPEVEIRTFVRDFKSSVASGGHPDFQYAHLGHVQGIPGLACNTQNTSTCGRLDAQGKPALQVNNQAQTGIMNAQTYGLWFRDGNPNNVQGLNGVIQTQPTFQRTLILSQVGGPTSERYEFDATANFFPLGPSEGFGPVGAEAGLCSSHNDGNMNGVRCQEQCQWENFPNRACDTGCGGDDCRGQNFGFTTELRYFFQYKGGEELVFRGDDDVWVFINGRLAVDIGGLHQARYGRVILGDDGVQSGGTRVDDSDCSVHGSDNVGEGGTIAEPAPCTLSSEEAADNQDERFGLTRGNVYEIVLFHAERHTAASNFRLTLSGFIAPRSYCEPECGDGIVVGWEVCDDGSENSDTEYGACNTSCTGRTFCGDGVRQQPDEACDNGRNLDIRSSGAPNECAPGCRLPSRCGDGLVQAAFEMCDNGASNSNSSYGVGSCKTDCTFGGYCGDGIVNGPEICDFAVPGTEPYGPDSCGYNCEPGPYCGDGVRNGPEECDGTPNCGADCRLMPFCGDGVVSAGESCDYAQFASDEYGGCTASCEWGPRCGDGEQQQPFEECDRGGSNSDTEYGGCTTSCNLGPRCGDRIVHAEQGEACDNGFNDDAYEYTSTSCGVNCTRPPHCGDGAIQSAFEQCDEGSANSDTAYDGCTTSCTWGPYCGDGTANGPESCDDGSNNVLYRAEQGACGYDCEWAPYCGDGVRNGPEQCDIPESEGGNTGAYGGCKADCTRAPFCGDGVVQADEGEQCDDGPLGSLSCTATCRRRTTVTR